MNEALAITALVRYTHLAILQPSEFGVKLLCSSSDCQLVVVVLVTLALKIVYEVSGTLSAFAIWANDIL